jgi:hypothetical protein
MRSAMVEALTLTTENTAPPAELPAVRTSAEWVAYFRANAANLLDVPWGDGPGASPDELAPILASLRGWQLGETSDGAQLRATAERYGAKINDPDFVEAIKLFIAEEQRHGETLGLFLDLAGVPRKTWDWGDAVFRVFRHFRLRMEVWASVVVMVEVHAMIYYAAVRRSTGSPVLRRVCEQILRDEVPHIRFQCERLALIRRNRNGILRWLTAGVQRALFGGITVAVWVGHRRALRAGGFTLGRFWRSAWRQMRRAWGQTNPSKYRWPA